MNKNKELPFSVLIRYMDWLDKCKESISFDYLDNYTQSLRNFCLNTFGYVPMCNSKWINRELYICYRFRSDEDAALFKIVWL